MSPAQATADSPSDPAATAPPKRLSRPHFAALIFCGVYPLVTLQLYALFPLTAGWTLWQRNLVLVPITVAAMVWLIIPAIRRNFHGFIHR